MSSLAPEPSLEVIARAIEVLDYNSTKKAFFEKRKLHAQLYRPLTPEKVKPLENSDDKDSKVNPSKEDSKVQSVVNSFNNSTKDPTPKTPSQKIPKHKKSSNSYTNLSSAATPTLIRHNEDMRSGAISNK